MSSTTPTKKIKVPPVITARRLRLTEDRGNETQLARDEHAAKEPKIHRDAAETRDRNVVNVAVADLGHDIPPNGVPAHYGDGDVGDGGRGEEHEEVLAHAVPSLQISVCGESDLSLP